MSGGKPAPRRSESAWTKPLNFPSQTGRKSNPAAGGSSTKALAARGDCKKVRAIVAYGFEPSPNETVNYGGFPVPVISWSALLQKGAAVQDHWPPSPPRRMGGSQIGGCGQRVTSARLLRDP